MPRRLRVTNNGQSPLPIAAFTIPPGQFMDFDEDQVPGVFRAGATVLPDRPPAESGMRVVSILQSQLATLGETADNQEIFYRVTDLPNEPIYRVVGGKIRALVEAENTLTGGVTFSAPIPVTLSQCGVPIGMPPSGTVAENGALTLDTALATTYSDGIWLYFPTGTAYAASVAGFYWVVMSSTTVGTLYDTTYTPSLRNFDIPASPSAIVAAGPGAYVAVTVETTVVQWTIPGGLLGNHGQHDLYALTSAPSTAGSKAIRQKLNGGGLGLSMGVTTGNQLRALTNSFTNRGRPDRQVAIPYQVVPGATTQLDGDAQAVESVNTAADSVLTLTLQSGAVADFLLLLASRGVVTPS